MTARHRVLLVREWDAHGSGCCGAAGSLLGEPSAPRAADPAQIQAMAAVYRALRARFGSAIDVQVVDPRNMIWLVPAIWQDGRRRALPWPVRLRQCVQGVSRHAIVLDGQVLSTGAVPKPEQVVAAVERATALTSQAPSLSRSA